MNGGSSQFRNILNWFKPQQELSETERPTLVNVGRHAGSSRVVYKGLFIPFHLITKGKSDLYLRVFQ